MRNLYRTITEWSVALSGLLLFSCTLGWVLFDGDDALVDLIEVSLPALVGISFLIGGVWLARTHQALRVGRLSLWTAGGAITGVAVNVWNRFVISLEHMPAGEPIPLTLNDAGIFMAASVLLGYYATGLQQREQELAESESRFRALTENSSFAVVTIDETSTIQYANDAVKDLFGYSSAALVGDTLTKLMPEQLQGAHRDGVAQYLSAGDRTIDWDGIEIRGRGLMAKSSQSRSASGSMSLTTTISLRASFRTSRVERRQSGSSGLTRRRSHSFTTLRPILPGPTRRKRSTSILLTVLSTYSMPISPVFPW